MPAPAKSHRMRTPVPTAYRSGSAGSGCSPPEPGPLGETRARQERAASYVRSLETYLAAEQRIGMALEVVSEHPDRPGRAGQLLEQRVEVVAQWRVRPDQPVGRGEGRLRLGQERPHLLVERADEGLQTNCRLVQDRNRLLGLRRVDQSVDARDGLLQIVHQLRQR